MIVKSAAIALLCGLPALALAQDSPICPKPISFALYENGSIYETASNTGIDKDVADELSKRSGCRFEYSVKPRARIWYELENGDLMMTGSGIQTAQRELFSWSVRYMAQKNYVLVANSLNINSAVQFAAQSDLLWGAVRSYKHGVQADEFLSKLRQNARVKEEADLEAVLRIFGLPNRTAALFAPPPAYAKYVKEMNLASRIRIEDWFPEDRPIPHGMFFSKKYFSAPEFKKWRLIIDHMRTDGTLKTIYKKHLGEVDAERMLQFSVD